MRFRAFAVFLSLVPVVAAHRAQAEEPRVDQSFQAKLDRLMTPGGLTADAAAVRAAESDPTVQRRAAVIAERRASLASTELGRVPQLAATLSYARLSEVDMPVLGPGIKFPQVLDQYVMRLELGVPLTDYLQRFPALVAAQELRVEAARFDRKIAERAAGRAARVAYWRWVRSKLYLLVSEQSAVQVEAMLAQVQARVDAQRASRADLLRIESLAADARRGVFVARGRVQLDESALRQAIGAAPDETLSIGENLAVAPTLAALGEPMTTLVDRAVAQRAEIATLDRAIAALEASKGAQIAGYYPRIDATASVDYDNPNARVFLGGARFDATWVVGLRLSWKLGDALGAGPALDAISAQVEQLRADREALRRQLETGVAEVRQGVENAIFSRETTAQARIAAEEGYRMRTELLGADRATAMELVDAETVLTRSRGAELDAFIDLRIALSDFSYTLGEDPK